jgi:hypothetical protein
MASAVEICNMALSHIRAGSINSLAENSVQAQQCRLLYPTCRNMVLENAPWGFARSIRELALLSSVKIFNYAYAYQYPSDAMRINKLMMSWDEVTNDSAPSLRYHDDLFPGMRKTKVVYEIFHNNGTRVIAANDIDLRVDYNVVVEDPNLFSTSFIFAVSHLLASNLAIPLIGTTEGRLLRNDELQLYTKYIDSAVAADANQSYTPIPDSDYITVR